MQSEMVDQFETEIASYGVDVTHASVGDATDVIAEHLDSTAVGVPLPWDGVSLPGAVTTDPTPDELEAAKTGLSPASLGIATYGSLALRADDHGSEPISLFVDTHVAVLHEEDIVADMPEAFEWLGEELRETRDSVILATGPSATADMGALVQGAHGPKTVELIIIS
ncbi:MULTISPECIES: LUD domain-containing protein [Salinibaculum]|uniref:LUD domain-containing protein n=1 Tax=Salinibaculum TaxID=2732368 RepID=UPI0030D4C17C